MELLTKEIGNSFILGVDLEVISEETVRDIDMQLSKFSADKKIALDLSRVNCICGDFLEFLRTGRGLSLINIQSEIFALLNLTKHDKFVDIYLSEGDFLDGRYSLINRRFSLL